jgi:ureidoacrylate peracid hydrolase
VDLRCRDEEDGAPGAPGTEFDSCLTPQPTDIEVVEQRYSAFVGTRLDETLQDRGIVSVIVLGLTTNVCVQSTARDAWQRDYGTITLADCCAEVGEGSHPERSDKASGLSRIFNSPDFCEPARSLRATSPS